ERFAGHPHLWFMLCASRQINWPDTLAEVISTWEISGFEPGWLTVTLTERKKRGEKIYTGAYMISAPADKRADKQAYIAQTVIGDLWRRREVFEMWFAGAPTLQGTHERITRSNGWGPFMAYQAVVDMRFTSLLERAPDVEDWAAAGPGTIRGLNRLYG